MRPSKPGLKLSGRRPWLWLAPAALIALFPKCPLCAGVWVLAAVGLGMGGPEFCGVEPDHGFIGLVTAAGLLSAGALGIILWLRRRPRT